MKKMFLSFCVMALYQINNAQAKLENIYKIEIGLQGVSAGTEFPLSDKFLADVNLGWGGITDLWHNGIFYEWSKNSNSLFARGQVRYYLSRERREEKGHSLKNNAGTFIAY